MHGPLGRLFDLLGVRRDSSLAGLIKGASLVGVLKGLSALFGFALSVVLGRVLGAEPTGAYFLAFTTATIAATIGRVGLDSAVIRHVAAEASNREWARVRSIQRSASSIGLICSTAVTVLLYLSSPLLATRLFSDPSLTTPLQLMALAVVPLSLSVLISRSLQGLSAIRDSVLVFSIFPTGIALAGTAVLSPSWGVDGAIVAYIVAVTAALAYGLISWRRALSSRAIEMPSVPSVQSTTRDLLQSGPPLLIGALLQLVIQMSGTLMLGIWADKTDVSQFAVAWRTALLLTFVLLAVNTIAQPKFAELYAHRRMDDLAATAHKATLLMAICAAPPFLVFLLAPKLVMSAFGSDFVDGAATLQILSIGQFVNVASGSVGVLLVMSGYERDYRNVQIVAAVAALALNVALIPPMGAVGAGIATASALIAQNLLFGYYCWRRMGILTLIPRRHLSRRQDSGS